MQLLQWQYVDEVANIIAKVRSYPVQVQVQAQVQIGGLRIYKIKPQVKVYINEEGNSSN